MVVELIDSHTHLDAEEFSGEVEMVIARAKQAGVTRLVTVGAGGGFDSALRATELAERYECVWASVGIHPHDAAEEFNPDRLAVLAAHRKVVAVGETGLDFYRDWSPRNLQEKWFRAQVELALRLNLPLIIHSRDAGQECLGILTEMEASKVGGVFHCFSEDAEFASRLREINFMVSIPGSVTFKKAKALRETVNDIPLSQIMVETDAPYLSPEPYRGKRCESAYVVETAKKIAEIKGISLKEFARTVTANTVNFYRLD